MKPYYYVFNRTRDGAPSFGHNDQAKAVAEAERLAKKHPGVIFEVCKVIAFAKVNAASVFWMDGEWPKPNTTVEDFH